MSDKRCDATLANGKRCKNDALYWAVYVIYLTGEEKWPVAVCEAHRNMEKFTRAGPDRRKEYANRVGDGRTG